MKNQRGTKSRSVNSINSSSKREEKTKQQIDSKSCFETTEETLRKPRIFSWPNEHLCCTMKEKIFYDSHQIPLLQATVEPTLCIRTSKFETHLVPYCGIYSLVYDFVTEKVQLSELSEKQRGCVLHPLATNVTFCLNELDKIEIAEPNYWISKYSLRLVKKENDKQIRLTAFSTSVPVSYCGTYQFCILSGWTSWSLTLKNQKCNLCKTRHDCSEKESESKQSTIKKEVPTLELPQKPQFQAKTKQKKNKKKKKKRETLIKKK